MRGIAALLLLVPSVVFADLKKMLDPHEAIKLRKGEVCRYYRYSAGHYSGRKYQSLVVVRTDYTVIVKATDFEDSFKMNAAQIKDWQSSMSFLDPKAMRKERRTEKGKPSDEAGGIDCYLAVKKNGKLYTGDNVRWRPGFVPIIDNLEVFAYLSNPHKNGK
jgi:hypothetical protein